MVRILATQIVDVQRNQGMVDQALEEFAHEIDIKGADRCAGESHPEHESGPPRKIDNNT